ncbi:MAG: hypothetical protein H6983_26660 [Ectothiorhodospiraceae bacterium]|nr:hypothetical protein [Ectothiorhodospiraceae bacterium]
MAKAKRPKQEAAENEVAARLSRAATVLEIHPIGTDLTFRFAAFNVPIGVQRTLHAELRAEPVDLLGRGLPGVVAAWWVSRLAGGEDVTLAEVESEWDERCAGTSISSVQVEAIDAAEAVDAEKGEAAPES